MNNIAWGVIIGFILALALASQVYSYKAKKCEEKNRNLENQILLLGQASSKLLKQVHSRDSVMEPLIAKSKYLNEKYNANIDTIYINDMDSLLREFTRVTTR